MDHLSKYSRRDPTPLWQRCNGSSSPQRSFASQPTNAQKTPGLARGSRLAGLPKKQGILCLEERALAQHRSKISNLGKFPPARRRQIDEWSLKIDTSSKAFMRAPGASRTRHFQRCSTKIEQQKSVLPVVACPMRYYVSKQTSQISSISFNLLLAYWT